MKRKAADSPFAARMMEKPLPESLNVTSNDRHFYDPPEVIQQWFGGRSWFLEMGNTKVHRVGLFRGIGWELDSHIASQDERGITGVRITARNAVTGKPKLYDMEFMARRIDYDEAGFQEGLEARIVHSVPGLAGEELVASYAAVLGEHAV